VPTIIPGLVPCFQQLEDDERTAVVGADVKDSEEIRMVQRSGCARFLLEASKMIRVAGQ
jgi:hypothetical protein